MEEETVPTSILSNRMRPPRVLAAADKPAYMGVRTIGIDLGTTFCCVAYFNAKTNEVKTVICHHIGNPTTPSYVAFTDEQMPLTGLIAKSQAPRNLKNTVYDAKRFIGRTYDDPVVQADKERWEFDLVDDGGKPKVPVQHRGERKLMAAEDISAIMLKALKEDAVRIMEEPPTHAVVTVPAHFNMSQRQATLDAAKIAGIEVLRICSEPAAAAIDYGFEMDKKATAMDGTMLVYDFGGGTLDVSIMRLVGGCYQVLTTGGNMHLGGEDFTNRLVKYCKKKLKRDHNLDVERKSKASFKLRMACETAKLFLSRNYETVVEFEYRDRDYPIKVSRTMFETVCERLFDLILKPVDDALKSINMSRSDITEVLAVGGTSRIPKVQEMLKEYFGEVPVRFCVNPDEAIARGAAIVAAILAGEQSERLEGLRLLEILPQSLGVEDDEGQMKILLERGKAVPCSGTYHMQTVEDNQVRALVSICEGEDPVATKNRHLGDLIIDDIPQKPKGSVVFRIKLDVGASGIFEASAVMRSGGRDEKVTKIHINDVSRFSDDDLSKRKITTPLR